MEYNYQIKAYYKKYTLRFRKPAKTSRDVMHEKISYFIFLKNEERRISIGECSPILGLSIDPINDFEQTLSRVCRIIETDNNEEPSFLNKYPSILFGLEQAKKGLKNENQLFFPSSFTEGKAGIPINGLIWMGDFSFMNEQIEQKIQQDYRCIKIKIGAHDWNDECQLLTKLRKEYSKDDLEIRVDANGAFTIKDAPRKLEKLNALEIHSIEQPIPAGNWNEMTKLCKNPDLLPIALDEELIGDKTKEEKRALLTAIQPKYIILKPSLLGGWEKSNEWIMIAEELNIEWWATSALESNVGLNGIAQWVFSKNNSMAQGLGTGALYTNNIPSPLKIVDTKLVHDSKRKWKWNNLF